MYDKLFKIIAIEGIDGSGKSTVIQRLKANKYLLKTPAYFTEEPRKRSPYRKALLSDIGEPLSPISQLILVTADRYEHIKEYHDLVYNRYMLIENLITDRYNDSTWIYQVVLGGVAEGTFHKFEEIFEIQQPDLVILLDIDPKVAQERINSRNEDKNTFDSIDLTRKEIMRQAYLDRASLGYSRNVRYHVLDAELPIDELVTEIITVINEFNEERENNESSK